MISWCCSVFSWKPWFGAFPGFRPFQVSQNESHWHPKCPTESRPGHTPSRSVPFSGTRKAAPELSRDTGVSHVVLFCVLQSRAGANLCPISTEESVPDFSDVLHPCPGGLHRISSHPRVVNRCEKKACNLPVIKFRRALGRKPYLGE